MGTGQHIEDLGAALTMTEEMMGVAKDEDWDKLSALEAKRQGLIKSAFARPIPPADSATVAASIRRIQALTRDLISVISQGRDSIADALDTMAKGRRARSAYGGASGT